eukprot:859547-Rhodomonas_salina.1
MKCQNARCTTTSTVTKFTAATTTRVLLPVLRLQCARVFKFTARTQEARTRHWQRARQSQTLSDTVTDTMYESDYDATL